MKKTQSLEEIKQSFQKGNLCILPTDTILGLFADANNHDAILKIFQAKKREYAKPLAIFVHSISAIQQYGIETAQSKTFTQKNLPGEYTILLHATNFAKTHLSHLLISQDGKIGIRIPKQNDILKLTKEIMICGTSVNITGQEFAKDTIPQEIANNVEFILQSKATGLSQNPSTIIDFTTQEPIIIR